jgi:hypothetical protein
MTTTTHDLARLLSDPAPPTPGATVRAAVQARSASIVRRRRVARAGAAVGCVALLALGGTAIAVTASRAGGDDAQVAAAPSNAEVVVRVTDEVVPVGVVVEATLVGTAGTFHARARTPDRLAFDAVPPGDYELRWVWSSDDGAASAAGRAHVRVDAGDDRLTITR